VAGELVILGAKLDCNNLASRRRAEALAYDPPRGALAASSVAAAGAPQATALAHVPGHLLTTRTVSG
jgi:hypothetical protein